MFNFQSFLEEVNEYRKRRGRDLLTPDDFALYEEVRKAYRGLIPVPCTGCEYCIPCPNGVAIPEIFTIYNDAIMYNDPDGGRMRYNAPMPPLPEEQADNCTECEECLEKCPQGIDIPHWLKEAHAYLSPESK